MVNAKNVAFKVNKQTPISQTPLQAYGTVINCRKPGGKKAPKEQKEVRSHYVPLANVEGTLKRKRDDIESLSLYGAAANSLMRQVDAASTPQDRPPFSQRYPQSKITKSRKNKGISKGVDLDSWFIILSFSDPAQLLLMRSGVPSCYRFLRDFPTLWKLSRKYHYGDDLPEPPSELTEFQYTDLRHDHGCMSCKAPNTRKTYWAFLRRWCKTCLQSKTLKEHDAMVMLRDANGEDISYLHKCLPSGIFDSWGNFVGVGPATTHALKTVYLLSDVQKLVAEYINLKAQNTDPATWTAELYNWHDPKVKLVEERRHFATKMEAWEEMMRSERSFDYTAKKAARKDFYQKQAAQLVPPISVDEMECCPSYRRAIAIPKDPNNVSWLQLKPKLEKEAAELRSKDGAQEDRPHQRHSSSSGSATPDRRSEPPQPQPSSQPQQPQLQQQPTQQPLPQQVHLHQHLHPAQPSHTHQSHPQQHQHAQHAQHSQQSQHIHRAQPLQYPLMLPVVPFRPGNPGPHPLRHFYIVPQPPNHGYTHTHTSHSPS